MSDRKEINRIKILHPILKVLAKKSAFEQFKKSAANDNKKDS